MRLADGYSASGAKVDEIVLGLGIENPAAAYNERRLGRPKQLGGVGDFAQVGRNAADAVHPFLEERCWIVVGLYLHVLAEGEDDGAAFGGVGQNRDRSIERRHDLFGARDAVEIPRHRAEAVIGADCSIVEILDLLQNRVRFAGDEDVAGNEVGLEAD